MLIVVVKLRKLCVQDTHNYVHNILVYIIHIICTLYTLYYFILNYFISHYITLHIIYYILFDPWEPSERAICKEKKKKVFS